MLKKRNQKGFTLIEIIAVLVILGILAAVAIPKFLDLQQESRNKAIEGALAAGASQLTMQFSRDLLISNATANNWTYADANYPLGDFYATLAGTCGANSTVTIISGPTWVADVNATSKIKSIKICNP